ncbi:hypothetical protein [uncultured Desulfosarcina sp.]|uniref:hypothetical protein n=1 Tax=uncultured Desulfosarcina sp. TaxID=218289 RepID=UPI0029C678B3|nr:hypothetical protein [uncultured Desulfosarcina sp.]
MNLRIRVILLIVIMSIIVLVVEGVTVGLLFHTALKEEKSRLVEMAKSQARLIEAVARFNKLYFKDVPDRARQATLNQIRDAHTRYEGHGNTGEFTLSKRENDQIIFLLSHRHYDLNSLKPVPWDSSLAEPMRLALSGNSGTVIGLDYRGVKVLAAYEPVAELNLGIVSKIDYSEIKEPFYKAVFISAFFAIAAIILGASIFLKITNPLIERLQKTVVELEKALKEVKTLRGIVPICSFCKKIRNDQGYWDQVEVYVRHHTEANFSHGVCPDCMKIHYPEFVDT